MRLKMRGAAQMQETAMAVTEHPDNAVVIDPEEAGRLRAQKLERIGRWVLPMLIMALAIFAWDQLGQREAHKPIVIFPVSTDTGDRSATSCHHGEVNNGRARDGHARDLAANIKLRKRVCRRVANIDDRDTGRACWTRLTLWPLWTFGSGSAVATARQTQTGECHKHRKES